MYFISLQALAVDEFKRASEKISRITENHRPNHGADDIEKSEKFLGNVACADDKRRNNPEPVEKSESQKQNYLMFVKNLVDFLRFPLPFRALFQNRPAFCPAEHKEKLVA